MVVRTLEETPAGGTHWSKRELAKVLGISPASVLRIWHAFGLQPWRTETFKISPCPPAWPGLRPAETTGSVSVTGVWRRNWQTPRIQVPGAPRGREGSTPSPPTTPPLAPAH